jgi:dihydroneopterin aldolase
LFRGTARGVQELPADATDCIHIEQLEVFARIGVTENERRSPQRLTFNITVWPSRPFEQLEDDIGQTANYSAVSAAVREAVEAGTTRLIETLAVQIANRLLQLFPVRTVKIEVRKFVLPQAQHVAAIAVRHAGEG